MLHCIEQQEVLRVEIKLREGWFLPGTLLPKDLEGLERMKSTDSANPNSNLPLRTTSFLLITSITRCSVQVWKEFQHFSSATAGRWSTSAVQRLIYHLSLFLSSFIPPPQLVCQKIKLNMNLNTLELDFHLNVLLNYYCWTERAELSWSAALSACTVQVDVTYIVNYLLHSNILKGHVFLTLHLRTLSVLLPFLPCPSAWHCARTPLM